MCWPAGARVGTGAPRRAAQLRAARPDLEVVDIRGNVDTRIRFVTTGRLDAVVLAAAGLHRLGRTGAITQTLELESWPTAPGQGVLAIEVREADAVGTPLAGALATIHDAGAWAASTAERSLLAALEAGCAAPVGAAAVVSDDLLTLRGTAYRPDGGARLDEEGSAPLTDAEELGRVVANDLLGRGASDWVQAG